MPDLFVGAAYLAIVVAIGLCVIAAVVGLLSAALEWFDERGDH